MMSASRCTRAHCKEQLGDVSRVTGAGLARMMVSCTVPLRSRRSAPSGASRSTRATTRRRNGSTPRARRREGAELYPRGEDDSGEGRGLLVSQPGVRRGHRPPERDAHLQGVRLQRSAKSVTRRSTRVPCAAALDEMLIKHADSFQETPDARPSWRKDGARSRDPVRPDVLNYNWRARPRPMVASTRRSSRGAAPGERRAGARLGQRRQRLRVKRHRKVYVDRF